MSSAITLLLTANHLLLRGPQTEVKGQYRILEMAGDEQSVGNQI
jgi:hypothetical protein